MKTVFRFLTLIVLVSTTLLVGCKENKTISNQSKESTSNAEKEVEKDYKLLVKYIDENRSEAEEAGVIKKFSHNTKINYVEGINENYSHYKGVTIRVKLSEDKEYEIQDLHISYTLASKWLMKSKDIKSCDKVFFERMRPTITWVLYHKKWLYNRYTNDFYYPELKNSGHLVKDIKCINSIGSIIVNDSIILPYDVIKNLEGRTEFKLSDYGSNLSEVEEQKLSIEIIENLDNTHPHFEDFCKEVYGDKKEKHYMTRRLVSVGKFDPSYERILKVTTYEISLKEVIIKYKDIKISFIPKGFYF
jgi:hypothetical protein